MLMILYNLACIHQMAGSFEECTKYIDASIFNMSQKSTAITPEDGLSLNKLAASAKMLKTRFLCKFHLQMCAVLSQLNRHREGLFHGFNAILYSHELINYTAQLCEHYSTKLAASDSKAAPRSGAGGASRRESNSNTRLRAFESPFVA